MYALVLLSCAVGATGGPPEKRDDSDGTTGDDSSQDSAHDADSSGDSADSAQLPDDCHDGVDGDGDSWVDSADPDCDLGSEEVGFGTGECNDGVDNDADGGADADDAVCPDAYAPTEGRLAPVGVVNLGDADAIITGDTAHDYAANDLTSPGDLDGDGVPDVYVTRGRQNAEQAYLFPGPVRGVQTLASAPTVFDFIAYRMAAGDVDGDNAADIVLTDFGNDAYVLSGPFTGALHDAGDAFAVLEADSDFFGIAVLAGRDLTGDGEDDLLIGSPEAFDGTGGAFVYTGPLGSGVTASSAAPAVLHGAGSWFGCARADLGDLNGDGSDDLAVGAQEDTDSAPGDGRLFGFYGPLPLTTIPLSAADFSVHGENENDHLGRRIHGVGDTDGDGIADVLLGPQSSHATARDAGSAYLFDGAAFSSDLDVGHADVIWRGEAESDFAGSSLQGAGDVDGDGRADYLIGADHSDRSGDDAGAAYLVYGGGAPGVYGLGMADTIFKGVSADNYAGGTLAGGQDLDADGFDDILVGANFWNAATGAAYVFYGGVR